MSSNGHMGRPQSRGRSITPPPQPGLNGQIDSLDSEPLLHLFQAFYSCNTQEITTLANATPDYRIGFDNKLIKVVVFDRDTKKPAKEQPDQDKAIRDFLKQHVATNEKLKTPLQRIISVKNPVETFKRPDAICSDEDRFKFKRAGIHPHPDDMKKILANLGGNKLKNKSQTRKNNKKTKKRIKNKKRI